MKLRFIAIIYASLLAFAMSCGAPVEQSAPPHDDIEGVDIDMPGYVPITAADAGPGAPFASILCPDDGVAASGEDLQRLAAALLANDGYQRVRRAQWTYDVETPAFTFIIFSQDAYESPGSGGYIEFPGAAVGDTIQVSMLCDAQNGITSTGNGNRLRLAAIDDYGGAGETAAAAVPGARAYINAPDEQMNSVAIGGEWIVTVAGATRIYMQGRVDTEPGELRIQSRVFLSGEHRSAATESITPP